MMGALFSKPKIPDPPPVPPPEAIPEVGDQPRRKRRRGSRQQTVVTGDLATSKLDLGKKTLLGG